MDTQLLQKYLRDECSSEEARHVLTYLASAEGQRQLQHLLSTNLDDLDQLPLQAAERQNAQHLFSRIQANKKTEPNFVSAATTGRRIGQRSYWLVAATVSLLILTVGAWWTYQFYATPETLSLHTDFGQIQRVTLPDQSVVTLNGNTTIRYQKRWSATRPREVWVEGEAFFEVIHKKNHQPFQVHLPEQMNVEVLGTRFNVYTRESSTKVVLNEGSIQMSVANSPANHLAMKPGEMFFADTKARIFYKKPVDAQAHSSWRTDKLVFNGTTLAEIATLLKETYGLDVEIGDQKLANQKFSGTIPSKNADTILKGLSSLFDLTITQKNKHVLIE